MQRELTSTIPDYRKSTLRQQEITEMADKSDKGAWAVIRYLPGLDPSEGELPAHFDGWYAHRDAATAVAKDSASQYPEAHVAVVVQPNRYLRSGGEQQNR
jgi:hypothetical protein